jgi:hypothetical protein
MKLRIQNFDHRSSSYERPNQAWVCGRAATGKPCALGPDGKGQCRTLGECRPRKTPDGWICTRPKEAGGMCELGPSPDGRCCQKLPPCQPVRSFRSRRGLITGWATMVSIALLVLIFGGRLSTGLIDPGPLHSGHAEITDCNACHVNFEGGFARWLPAAFGPANPTADSRKCLDCHQWGDEALNAHNLGQPALTEITQKFEEHPDREAAPWTVQLSRTVFPQPAEAHNGLLACASCHKEHEGEHADLLSVSNARCQSCHEMTFEAFSAGHPSFGDYPYLRRTRITFDHDSHNRKNFPEKIKQGVKAPETCDACHQVEGTGRTMMTASFDTTCATCHTADLIGESVAGPKGTPVIAVPELDLETLVERQIGIGEWPEFAFATEFSPYTKLLLAADPQIRDDLETIETTDLQDLTDADGAEIEAVARIAWAIKELLFDLTIEGMGVLQAKVEQSLDSSLDTDTVGRLVGHIPQDVVTAAGASWFPNLKKEVVAYRDAKAASLAPAAIRGQAAGDTLSDDQLLNVDDNAVDPEGELLQLDEKGNPAEGVEVRAAEPAPAAAAPAAEAPAAAAPTAAAPTAAAEAPAAADQGPAVAEKAVPQPVARPAAGGTVALDQDPVEEVTAENEELGLPTLDPEDWAKAGGWYRKDYILYYRPVGHQDVVFRTWLDISAQAFGTPAERYGDALFKLLADKNTPGKCTKCHSVDQQPGGGLVVNWAPFQPTPTVSQFTEFKHDTHFSAISGEDGCITCHRRNEAEGYLKSYESHSPTTFTANFAPMKRELCITCHIEDSAGDGCTMCHQYHIGDIGSGAMSTPMQNLDRPEPVLQEVEAPAGSGLGRALGQMVDEVLGGAESAIEVVTGDDEADPAPPSGVRPTLDFDPGGNGSQLLPDLLNDLLSKVQADQQAAPAGGPSAAPAEPPVR